MDSSFCIDCSALDITAWQARFDAYMQHHSSDDAAHDIGHFRRVWRNAQTIMQDEPANELVVLTACYFHDFVNLAKDDPNRHTASLLSGEKTSDILINEFSDFPKQHIEAVQHAIAAHSFSAKIKPVTIEAKIVQDADRLEALGPIGLTRVFYIAGKLGSGMFDSQDPLAKQRELNDHKYGLDHFQIKLLKLPETMQTSKGRELAEDGAKYLQRFMSDLSNDLKV